MSGKETMRWLLASSALGLAMGHEARAQQSDDARNDALLGEVVVTATRQNDTVNRVPLSITAVTQEALDQQGIKSMADIARTVPSVTFRRVGVDNNPQIAVRGIISNLGASTTGIYLDDVALQKRGINGAVTGNGTPIPALFDLERVEVLRGPQGTLFGSGSEGGTIRFIQPEPSLTDISSYARTEVSTVEEGDIGYEGGFAFGGPIIDNELGFRVAVFHKHTAGVLDHVSIYDGHTIAEDTDSGDQQSARVALAWQASDRLKISPSVYYAKDTSDNQSTWWEDVPRYTTQGGTFTNRVRVGEGASAANSSGFWLDFPNATIPAYAFGPYDFGPWKTPQAHYFDQNCGSCTAYTPFGPSVITIAATTVNGVTYPARTVTVPGQQPGPNAASIEGALSPRDNTLVIPSVVVDYDFGSFALKSITSATLDKTKVLSAGGFGAPATALPTSTTSATSVPGQFVGTTGANVSGGTVGAAIYPIGPVPQAAPGQGGSFLVLPGQAFRTSRLSAENEREQFAQEIRLSSDADQRLSWVGGGYYSYATQDVTLNEPTNFDEIAYFYRGIDQSFMSNGWVIGQSGVPTPVRFTCNPTATGAVPNATYSCVQTEASASLEGESYAHTERSVREWEAALFGEVNFLFTPKLKGTVGVRVARLSNAYTQRQWGAANGAPFPPTFVPTPPSAADPDGNPYPTGADNYQNTVTGKQEATPVTPKVGLSFQASSQALVYGTAAKGFRAGGVNVPVSPSNCAADIAALGGISTPLTYSPDSVWSYEIGSKLRILGAQVNTSVYYVDWNEPQLTITLACNSSFISNAGKAVSKGADIQIVRRFGNLTLSGSAAYTDAQYTQDVTTPSATGTPIYTVKNGDPLPVSEWQYSAAAQYDVSLMNRYDGYLRVDYQYLGSYRRNLEWQRNYDVLSTEAEPGDFLTARVGVGIGDWDINLFVNNVSNEETVLNVTHGTGAANVTNQSVRPREMGLQVTWGYGRGRQ